MATIYIHAGYGKCGSTAIQRWLERHRASLRENRVFVCGTSLQHAPDAAYPSVPIMLRAMTREADSATQTILKALSAEAERNDVVIWSSEALQRWQGFLTPIIQGLMAEHTVKVVLYMRSHVSWLLSAYAQWGIKHPTVRRKTAPHAASFQEFIEARAVDLDYPAALARWEETGAELVARSYDAVPDVVEDFIALTGLTGSSEGDRANTQLSTSTLAILKGVQSVRRTPATIRSFEKMLRTAKLTDGDIGATTLDLVTEDEDALAALHESYRTQRETLSARYGLELSDKVPRNPLTRPAAQDGGQDDLIAILSLLCFSLHERVEALEEQLKDEGRPT